MSLDDLVDLCRSWRLVECAVIESLEPERCAFSFVEEMIEAREYLAAGAPTSDKLMAEVEIHQAIVQLSASERLNGFMLRLTNELQLVLPLINSASHFNHFFLARHRGIFELLREGRKEESKVLIDSCLVDLHRQLVRLYRKSISNSEPFQRGHRSGDDLGARNG
ncbi:FCD domain-containing protein [Streptomyces qinglanensis]|uniref:FCD domain-containing protein n=1 Tax=Streptomyces qinglanensis TaxID=943816 RepID=UPI0037AD89D9